jgi:uncharacterized surface protein with fasciclin (FAS1) repeats
MKRIHTIALAGAAALALAFGATVAPPSFAREMTKMVGGAPMYPSKNIVQNAIHSKDHTTLVAAVKAAGLVRTLESPGPFTVFAPTNEAFAKLPAGTVGSLLKPQNRKMLTTVLTYHVVPGRITARQLVNRVKAGHGEALLKTVEGKPLAFKIKNGKLWVIDARGDAAQITIANVMQSNGVIHVIDTVLLPG